MADIVFQPQLTRDYILKFVSEEEIFEAFGVPIVDYPFKSPLRRDRTPTCKFYRRRKDNRLIMRDFGGDFWGDCFDLVERVTHKKYFYVLQEVARKFKLLEGESIPVTAERLPLKPVVFIQQLQCEIRVKRMPWTSQHEAYWKQYFITRKTLDFFQVAPVEFVWLNDQPVFWYGKKREVAFCYHFGQTLDEHDYKIYLPTRPRGEMRFLHNNPNILQGYRQLPAGGEHFIVTKAMKDVMCLHEFGIASAAPMSENQIISKPMNEEINSRFEMKFSFYDLDKVGITSMKAMRSMGYQPLFFNRTQPKDFSDFAKLKGYETTSALVETIKSYY